MMNSPEAPYLRHRSVSAPSRFTRGRKWRRAIFNLNQWAGITTAGVEAQIAYLEQEYDDGSSLPRLLYVWDGLTRILRDKGYLPEFLHQDLDRILEEPAAEDVTTKDAEKG
jgi:hypothetical protein